MTNRSQDRPGRQAGKRQRHMLRSLADEGVWFAGCGWGHGSDSQTEAVLDTLVLRGEVTNDYHDNYDGEPGPVRYWLTPAGWRWLIIDSALDLGQCSYPSKGFEISAHRIGRLSSLALLSRQGPVNWKGERV